MESKDLSRFFDFVEKDQQLKQLKLSIYQTITISGFNEENPKYQRFWYFFEVMRRAYIEANKMTGAGDVLSLNTQDMQNFCQHYVDEFNSLTPINL